MTINCIDERLKIIKKLWNREHDPHVIDILYAMEDWLYDNK